MSEAANQIKQLTEELKSAWMAKAQAMDKIQSLTVALQGVRLGEQAASERAQAAAEPTIDVDTLPSKDDRINEG